MRIYHETEHGKLYCGDSIEVLKAMASQSVDCCVTSPPYFALRDYGVDGQLGLEPTIDEYIDRLCNVFDEVKRVLRDDGTLWVNLGDTYGGRGNGTGDYRSKADMSISGKRFDYTVKAKTNNFTQPKSLCQIPSRFAIEMCNRGWILRNEIIWHKPNCMPSSAKDRFTVDFEKIFFFTKKRKYYFETQYEKSVRDWTKCGGNILGGGIHKKGGSLVDNGKGRVTLSDGQSRIKRAVWRVTTKGYKEAHFATYPLELIETPIKAGCPEFICKKCGKARRMTMVDSGERRDVEKYTGKATKDYDSAKAQNASDTKRRILESQSKIMIPQYSDCGCNVGFESGIVLDPFFGSGTTAIEALRQNKRYIGIDLNPEYCEIAAKRIDNELQQADIFREV